ncbi:SixA phosphatase family protein [Allohahella marinimesophila]|uniref:Phosphohistidine phosphatase SixA n=1 Tax=Allohahella marinimesophila TaxID=1054972 RepID=A0ABP7Q9Z3_9GAMM
MAVREFLLMRHGQAEAYGITDEERELTSRGARQAERQGKALDAFFRDEPGPAPSYRVIPSSYLRARETAELVMQQADCVSRDALTIEGITPEDSLQDAIDSLSAVFAKFPDQHFLVVCHMPVVALLDGHCLAGAKRDGRAFATAEIRRYRFPDAETYQHLAAGCAEAPAHFLKADE